MNFSNTSENDRIEDNNLLILLVPRPPIFWVSPNVTSLAPSIHPSPA